MKYTVQFVNNILYLFILGAAILACIHENELISAIFCIIAIGIQLINAFVLIFLRSFGSSILLSLYLSNADILSSAFRYFFRVKSSLVSSVKKPLSSKLFRYKSALSVSSLALAFAPSSPKAVT